MTEDKPQVTEKQVKFQVKTGFDGTFEIVQILIDGKPQGDISFPPEMAPFISQLILAKYTEIITGKTSKVIQPKAKILTAN